MEAGGQTLFSLSLSRLGGKSSALSALFTHPLQSGITGDTGPWKVITSLVLSGFDLLWYSSVSNHESTHRRVSLDRKSKPDHTSRTISGPPVIPMWHRVVIWTSGRWTGLRWWWSPPLIEFKWIQTNHQVISVACRWRKKPSSREFFCFAHDCYCRVLRRAGKNNTTLTQRQIVWTELSDLPPPPAHHHHHWRHSLPQ